MKRAIKLANAKGSSGHDSFLKGIIVNFDLEYEVFISPQIQRYNFLHFISSSSSMHTAKQGVKYNEYVDKEIIEISNRYIQKYNEDNSQENLEAMIANLPQGQIKFGAMTTNYLQLKTIYHQRKSHRLKGWSVICKWAENLPLFKELCLTNIQ